MADLPILPAWRVPIVAALALLALTSLFLFGPRLSRAAASCDHPSASSVTVQDGDTLAALARTYYGSEDCAPIIAQQNDIGDPSQLSSGELLTLAPAAPSDVATARVRYSWGVAGGPTPSTPTPTPTPLPRPAAAALAVPASILPQNPNGFIWPVVGPITQPFGVPELGVGLPHTGIDISQSPGSPIRAAESGRVTFAGGDPCCGLGYWVEINHGNRYASRYGHMMRPPIVLVGDYVQQGQIIGFSGDTGFSTGPHVHFEIRLDGNPIDPLRLLPTSP